MTEQQEWTAPYRDASAPVDERVEDLLGRMTLDEKVAQLTGTLPFDVLGRRDSTRSGSSSTSAEGIGDVSRARSWPRIRPARSMVDQLQRYLVERTRLGVPALGHSEALSGLLHQACELPHRHRAGGDVGPASVER